MSSFFDEHGFCIVPNAINKDVLQFLSVEFRLHEECMMYANSTYCEDGKNPYEDNLVKNSFAWYGFYGFETLMLIMKSEMQKHTGKNLLATYSYARIMRKGAIMKKHTDRPSCEISATICIDKYMLEDKYPFNFIDKKGITHSIHQNPGDMIIYQGMELPHWRDEYDGSGQIQAFIHYVDADGPYTELEKDTRPLFGLHPKYTHERIKQKYEPLVSVK